MTDGSGGRKMVVGGLIGAGVVVLMGGAVVGGIYLGRMTGHHVRAPAAWAPKPAATARGDVAAAAPAAVPDLTGQVAALEGNAAPAAPAVAMAPVATPAAPMGDVNAGQPPRYDFRDQAPPLSALPVGPVVQVVQPPAAEAPVVDVNVFSEQLQPLGEWVVVAGYGHCWRPQGIAGGWRPYTAGHWVYTEYGLMWVSDEPWGDICYHYGSWVEDGRWGWVWVPGRVWAPAWVAWRSGGDCLGWAPLPPALCTGRRAILEADVKGIPAGAFCFVPANMVMAGHLEKQVRPVGQNAGIIARTVNVTNIHMAVNDVVVNESVDAKLVEKVTNKKVEKVAVGTAGDAKEAEKLREQGKPVIYAPKGKADLGAKPGTGDLPRPQLDVEKLKPQGGVPVKGPEAPPAVNVGGAKTGQAVADEAKQKMEMLKEQQDAAEKLKQQQAADAAAKQKAADLLKQQEAADKLKGPEASPAVNTGGAKSGPAVADEAKQKIEMLKQQQEAAKVKEQQDAAEKLKQQQDAAERMKQQAAADAAAKERAADLVKQQQEAADVAAKQQAARAAEQAHEAEAAKAAEQARAAEAAKAAEEARAQQDAARAAEQARAQQEAARAAEQARAQQEAARAAEQARAQQEAARVAEQARAAEAARAAQEAADRLKAAQDAANQANQPGKK